jgi:PAS domain S-box-containing protein
LLDSEKFYTDMSSLNNELVNLQRELVKKNIELKKKNIELKASEDALRESQLLFAEVANTSPALFWMSGVDKLRTWFNQSWLAFTGRSLSQECGNGWTAAIFPSDLPGYLKVFHQAFETRQPFNLEYRLRHFNGEYKWFYDQAYPRYDAKGDFAGFIGFCFDITERLQAEARAVELEALRKLNKAKGDLLDNVSHELRTPLTSIKGNIETLMDPDVKWSKKQQLEFLMSANREADHLTLIIRNLLDMSHVESGQLSLDKQSYTLDSVLDFANARLKTLTAGHQLFVCPHAAIPALIMDKVRIAQVITNLVDNAVKFSPAGSRITIDAVLVDDHLILSVADSGIGMPPVVVASLFDRFYQAKRVVEGKTRGTGLGLAVCKGIVEAHGGKIWAESQEGSGSKFYFSLPLPNRPE